jgi:Leucine Rich repeat
LSFLISYFHYLLFFLIYDHFFRRSEASAILDLSGAILSSTDDALFITDYLETHQLTTFQEIDFSHCNLSVQGLESLCRIAGKLTDLESVILTGNDLPKTAGYIISKLFCSRGKLKLFNFEDNALGDIGVCAMAGAFSSNFSDLFSRISVTSTVFDSLQQNKLSLVRLNLSGNGIGDVGVTVLCEGLKTLLGNCYNNKQKLPLKSLLLDRNRITDKGAYVIAQLIDRGGLFKSSENHGNDPKSERNGLLFTESMYDDRINLEIKTENKITGSGAGTNWGFWVEKNEKNCEFNRKNISPKYTDGDRGGHFMNSTLLLEELGLGGNLLGNQGVSVILKAASCPLGMTEKTILGSNNNKNIQNTKNEISDMNYFGENVFHRNGTNSTDGEISDCISNIVFGTEHNPFDGVLLRKLNLGNSELNLESLRNLTAFLTTFKSSKKSRNNGKIISTDQNDDLDSNFVEIDFSYTENTGRELIKELAKLNNTPMKNTDSESKGNGSVFTGIVEKFVHAVRANKCISRVFLGELPKLLQETSILLSETQNDAIRNQEKERNNNNKNENENPEKSDIIDLSNFSSPEKPHFSSPFFSLLLDINTSLELLDTIKYILNMPPEMSDWIIDNITNKRKRNEKKKLKRNSILEICKEENNIHHIDKKNNIDSMSIINKENEKVKNNPYEDMITKLNVLNQNFQDSKDTKIISTHNSSTYTTHTHTHTQMESETNITKNEIHTESYDRGRQLERKSSFEKNGITRNQNNLTVDTGAGRSRSRERVREYLESKTKLSSRSPPKSPSNRNDPNNQKYKIHIDQNGGYSTLEDNAELQKKKKEYENDHTVIFLFSFSSTSYLIFQFHYLKKKHFLSPFFFILFLLTFYFRDSCLFLLFFQSILLSFFFPHTTFLFSFPLFCFLLLFRHYSARSHLT